MDIKRWTIPVAIAATFCLAVAAPVAAADPVRPFGGDAVGIDTMAPPAGCPAGAMGLDTIVSKGPFLHLGSSAIVSVHCTFVDPVTLSGTFGPGVTTITAASGDTLVLRHQGTFQLDGFPPTVSHASVTWVIVDGTGRFEGATGEGDSLGVVDVATGSVTMSYSGTISY